MTQMILNFSDSTAEFVNEKAQSLNLSPEAMIEKWIEEVRESDDLFYSECNMRYLDDAIKRIEAGQYSYHDLIEE